MIYFFTYGDSNYENSKKRIQQEAIRMDFDDVKIYGREDISQEFLEKTKPYIDMRRGGGYWLWKPYFLKKTFDMMNEGDYCIYADAGCHLNPNGLQRLKWYLETLDINDSGILSFAIQPEAEYTNEKVFEFFDIDKNSDVRKTRQYLATILYMRKCENTVNLVNEFYDTAINNSDLFTDTHNEYKRTQQFKDHRHDQSIFSMLRKKHKSIVIPDETYALNWNDLMHVPILATRIRG